MCKNAAPNALCILFSLSFSSSLVSLSEMERSDNGVRAAFSNCKVFRAGVTVMTPVFCMFLKRICGEFSFVPLLLLLFMFCEKSVSNEF